MSFDSLMIHNVTLWDDTRVAGTSMMDFTEGKAYTVVEWPCRLEPLSGDERTVAAKRGGTVGHLLYMRQPATKVTRDMTIEIKDHSGQVLLDAVDIDSIQPVYDSSDLHHLEVFLTERSVAGGT